MSMETVRQAVRGGKIKCPKCKKPVTKFDKFVQMIESAWDGPDSSLGDTGAGSKVTLICGNDGCTWQERTEYWADMIEE